jgi:hypothetical protein
MIDSANHSVKGIRRQSFVLVLVVVLDPYRYRVRENAPSVGQTARARGRLIRAIQALAAEFRLRRTPPSLFELRRVQKWETSRHSEATAEFRCSFKEKP